LKTRLRTGLQADATRVALREAAGASTYEIVRRADSAVIGEVKCRTDDSAGGWLTVGWIEVGEGWRGWGYGSEAVRLLEAEAEAARFRADVDAGNGLALYFWLRLGYRPASVGEVPGKTPRGIITMVRTRTQNREPRT
jgi:GNAT superfamily N-acetyltransferase